PVVAVTQIWALFRNTLYPEVDPPPLVQASATCVAETLVAERPVGAGGAVGGGGFTQLRIALSTFSRPPVIVIPERLATGSTFASKAFFSPAVLSVQAESNSRAAPETCGVAIDVPFRVA